jgi:hypothetical protein
VTDPITLQRPALLLDVDGVLNPLGPVRAGVPWTPPEGFERPKDRRLSRVLLNPGLHAPWLAELATEFDIEWATMWEHRANDLLSPIFGLDELPVHQFRQYQGHRHRHHGHGVDGIKVNGFELGGLDPFRPVAWVDDDIEGVAERWAEDRPGETLLVVPDYQRGLERSHVDKLLAWARYRRQAVPDAA